MINHLKIERARRMFSQNHKRLCGNSNKAWHRRGLSLVEIAVVILVIGIVTAIMIPMASQVMGNLSTSKQAKMLAGNLQNARNIAVGRNRVVVFEFDLEENEYRAYCKDATQEDGALDKCGIETESIKLAGVRAVGGSTQRTGKYAVHFLPNGVGDQVVILIGEEANAPDAIVELNRYLGKARAIVEENQVSNYDEERLLTDDQWQHSQD